MPCYRWQNRTERVEIVKVSGYVPCFNNQVTLTTALGSLLAQGLAPGDVFVVDDASTDDSVAVARSLNVEVKVNPRNCGRGYTRARAMREAGHELVLACDATKKLAPDFLAIALKWMDSPKVAAVFGRVVRNHQSSAVERWESRHIFKENSPGVTNNRASLATGGVLMRRSSILQAGNFKDSLRHSEDIDLGNRLLAAGFKVVFDPTLRIMQVGRTRFWSLMERYWRWHAGPEERTSVRHYLRMISYSVKVLAREDWAVRDYTGVPISLFVPHYQFWRSFCRGLRRSANC
jgi:GT2 family glycosyltransferase